MTLRIDAQLSPAMARWLTGTQGVHASPLRDLGLRDADDAQIFFAAREAGAVVMTKDEDFIHLVLRHGTPPQIIGIRCGNSSNARLTELLASQWDTVNALMEAGEPLVEISERRL